jgi:hypothetical protein
VYPSRNSVRNPDVSFPEAFKGINWETGMAV